MMVPGRANDRDFPAVPPDFSRQVRMSGGGRLSGFNQIGWSHVVRGLKDTPPEVEYLAWAHLKLQRRKSPCGSVEANLDAAAIANAVATVLSVPCIFEL
jgi:hypothetical protein